MMVHMDIFDSQIIAQNIINGADSFPLMAVPFFLLAGEIMNVGGLSKRIVDMCLALVGHIKGGLGYVTIVAGVILSALSGSAVADAAALSALLVPMMVAAGHDKKKAAGLVAATGIIGPVIPPSIAFVIFGVAANLSITKLFLAGIMPGIYIAVGSWFAWWWEVRKENIVPPVRKTREGTWACGARCLLGVGTTVHHHLWAPLRRVHSDRSRGRGRGLLTDRGGFYLSRTYLEAALCGVRHVCEDHERGDVPGGGSARIRVADHGG